MATNYRQQYDDIAHNYPVGTLLLMRIGDFYETFGESARRLHELTSVALTTQRDGELLAGVPYHAVDKYAEQLRRQGCIVAIVESP